MTRPEEVKGEGVPVGAEARRGRFGAFAYYCWAAGLVTLALTALQ